MIHKEEPNLPLTIDCIVTTLEWVWRSSAYWYFCDYNTYSDRYDPREEWFQYICNERWATIEDHLSDCCNNDRWKVVSIWLQRPLICFLTISVETRYHVSCISQFLLHHSFQLGVKAFYFISKTRETTIFDQLFPQNLESLPETIAYLGLYSLQTQLQASSLFSWSILQFAPAIFERIASLHLCTFLHRESCLVCGPIYNVQ